MATVSRPCLPQELVDTVINWLSDDVESLRASSLVSRRFVALSQKHLFSTIALRSEPQCRLYLPFIAQEAPTQSPTSRIIAKFTDLLESSPHLASYVHSLVLSDDLSETGHTLNPVSTWLSIGTSQCLVAILPRLRKLQTFHIQGVWQYSTAWSHFNAHLRNAMMNMFRLKSLSSLSIHWIHNFPLAMLRSCSQLKHLDLRLPSVSDDLDGERESQEFLRTALENTTDDAGQPRPQLESLTLSCSLFVLDWFIRHADSIFDLTHIRNLAFPGPSKGDVLCKYIWSIIQTCSGSLEHLALWPSNSVNTSVSMSAVLEKMDLTICTNLHSFDIFLNFDDDIECMGPRLNTPAKTIDWMCEILGKIPHLRGIGKVALRCYTHHYEGADGLLLRDLSSLSKVDDFLSEYPEALERVCLLVANSRLPVPEVLETMEGYLPRLCAKGIVSSELVDDDRIAVVF